MKKNHFSKFLALTAAVMLAAGQTIPAFGAAAYTPVEGTETTFKKYLILEAGAQVPNVTFSYTAAPGEARSADTADNTVMEVLPGIGSPVITDTVFTAEDTTVNAVQEGDIDVARAASSRAEGLTAENGVEFETAKGEKYAVKTAVVDLSGISFDEPGIYRYIVTETASAEDEARGIMHDNDTDRVLDVYVTDDGNGTLQISSYVLHTEDADVVIGTDMGSYDVQEQAAALEDKTDGFTNEYSTSDLTFRKDVAGNQASRDKWFALTLKLEGLTAGDKYTVSLADDGDENTADGNADAVSGNTASTIDENRGKANVTELTAGEDGTVLQTFYLQHGQSVAVLGLPLNASYEVTENAEDYKSEAGAVEGFEDAANGTMAQDVKTSFLNTRDGIIPTGVAMAMLPGLAAAAAGGAGLAVLVIRRRRRNG
ncbi:MAG: hypothetical protein J5865_06700 [Lachnospiraceae bacterium]|nr:hypothetical protein [Lachnospiraceae bacterium]